MKEKINTTLIAVTGMSPQVVAETLYALLVQQDENVTEIDVLTTSEGRSKLVELDLPSQILQMCKKFNKPTPRFDVNTNIHIASEESVELSDVRSNKDNLLFPDLIVKIIRDRTNNTDSKLHCSIAGGRKTMSVAMAFALSLFGRKQDRLSHVLVSKEFEASKKFYPENEKEAKEIVLADVPFIRLRNKLPLIKQYPDASFTELVSITQQDINEMIYLPSVFVEEKIRQVTIGDTSFTLPPFEFAVYYFFLKNKRFILGGKKFSKKDSEILLKYYKRFVLSDGQYQRTQAVKCMGGAKGFESVQKAISNIAKLIKNKLKNDKILNNYIISTRGCYGAKKYGIIIDKKKIVIK